MLLQVIRRNIQVCHPLSIASHAEKPRAWKVSINSSWARLPMFINVSYCLQIQLPPLFLAESLVDFSFCDLVVTSFFFLFFFPVECISNLKLSTSSWTRQRMIALLLTMTACRSNLSGPEPFIFLHWVPLVKFSLLLSFLFSEEAVGQRLEVAKTEQPGCSFSTLPESYSSSCW